ncbi:MAG TPA: alpha/beta hydrolase, partial [Roseateles sp.]|nr:alpha/beta hydrolase [Roseateles sp.]
MNLLHCQEQGQGPTPLLCLHSSGASGGQWRTAAEHLHTRRRVLTVDLLGHGRSAGWPPQAPDSLAIEADAVWNTVGDVELDLVGHSYGGAVALQMALERPERVRSLCLYEPVLFGLLRRYEPWGEAWQEISALAGRLERLLAARQPEAAGAMFC